MRLTDEDEVLARAGKLTCHGCSGDRVRKVCGLCSKYFCLNCYGAVDHCLWCEVELGIDQSITEVLGVASNQMPEPEKLPIGFLIRWNCPRCGCDNSVMPASWNKIIRVDNEEPAAYEYGGSCFDCTQEVTLKLLVVRGTEEEPPTDPREWADGLAMLTEREVRQLVLRMAGLLDSYAGKGRGEVDARIGDQVAQILMRRPQGR